MLVYQKVQPSGSSVIELYSPHLDDPTWLPVPCIRTVSVCPRVLIGSVERRPAYFIAGLVVLLEVEYPKAISPKRSTARLGMNRCMTLAPSGSQVAACGMLGFTLPPVTFTWYQRGA